MPPRRDGAYVHNAGTSSESEDLDDLEDGSYGDKRKSKGKGKAKDAGKSQDKSKGKGKAKEVRSF